MLQGIEPRQQGRGSDGHSRPIGVLAEPQELMLDLKDRTDARSFVGEAGKKRKSAAVEGGEGGAAATVSLPARLAARPLPQPWRYLT